MSYGRMIAQKDLIPLGAPLKLYNPKIVLGGDSFAANQTKDMGSVYSGTELDHQYISQGSLHWARMASFGAMSGNFALSNNFGVGNTTSRDYVTNQLASIIAATPQISFWRGVTNDVKSGNFDGVVIAFSETQANIAIAAKAHLAIGCLLVMYTIPARGDCTVQQRQQHNRINAYMRTLPAIYPNVVIVDLAAYFVDHTSATGSPLGGDSGSTTTLVDGTHESPSFAYIDGVLTWQAIQPYFALRNPLETAGVNNAYDATLNPTGNLMASVSEMLGTAGGFNGDANTSGTLATNWLARNFGNGITITASKGTRSSPVTGGAPWTTQRLVLGASGTGLKQVYLQGPVIAPGASGISIGDVLQAAAYVRVNNPTGLYALSLGLGESAASGYGQYNSDMFPLNISGTYYPWPTLAAGYEMIQEVPPLTVSSNVTSGVRMILTAFVNAATCAADFELALPNLTKH